MEPACAPIMVASCSHNSKPGKWHSHYQIDKSIITVRDFNMLTSN
jgi:hypothetical protein